MPTRRQEKAARVVKEAVSNAIANHLNDPRIEGFVSVTRVEVAADLRTADVYISIFGGDDAAQSKTFAAITHARSRIQSLLADEMQSKFCPVLRFLMDDKFKKAMEIIKLIDETTSERKKKEAVEREHNQP
ncbi:MAG: 30S ribosome-binding factor RbfA [Sedimentisphaerales bacterium]|nr:30S ribosome-binding factor RbfA [Sedimentisphaerales bacterium]